MKTVGVILLWLCVIFGTVNLVCIFVGDNPLLSLSAMLLCMAAAGMNWSIIKSYNK